jgi:hypothetical protein
MNSNATETIDLTLNPELNITYTSSNKLLDDQMKIKDITSTKKSCLIHIGHLHCRDNDTLIDIHKDAYKNILSHFSQSEFDNKQGDNKFIFF